MPARCARRASARADLGVEHGRLASTTFQPQAPATSTSSQRRPGDAVATSVLVARRGTPRCTPARPRSGGVRASRAGAAPLGHGTGTSTPSRRSRRTTTTASSSSSPGSAPTADVAARQRSAVTAASPTAGSRTVRVGRTIADPVAFGRRTSARSPSRQRTGRRRSAPRRPRPCAAGGRARAGSCASEPARRPSAATASAVVRRVERGDEVRPPAARTVGRDLLPGRRGRRRAAATHAAGRSGAPTVDEVPRQVATG